MNDLQHIAIVRRDAAQMRVVALRNKLFDAEWNAWSATT